MPPVLSGRIYKETTEANERPSLLVSLVFPVTGKCSRSSQGNFESKYLPWYTEFKRGRVSELIFELSRSQVPWVQLASIRRGQPRRPGRGFL